MPEEQVAVVRGVDFDVPLHSLSALAYTYPDICLTLHASSTAALEARLAAHVCSNLPVSLPVLRCPAASTGLPATHQRALSAIATVNL